eukprot:6444071-Ditylum_brightwellii.AAC.1
MGTASSLTRAFGCSGANNPTGNTTEEHISLFGQMGEEKNSNNVKLDHSVPWRSLGCGSCTIIKTFATNLKNSAGENGGADKGKSYPMHANG